MDALKQTWQAWSMRVDALSFRERILAFLAVAGVALSLMFVGLIEPALKRQEQMLASASELQQEVTTLRKQLASNTELNQNEMGGELGQLRAQFDALNQQMKVRENSLIAPGRMIAALKSLLATQSGLTLIALETEPGQPALTEPEAGAEAGQVPSGEQPAAEMPLPPARLFYKHGVTVRVQGSYVHLTDYVARLENQPWAVQWESIRLDAHQHPQLEMTLKLNTLSLEPTWARL